jgi:hypothetical protein
MDEQDNILDIENEEKERGPVRPWLYSRRSIFWFSFLFSTIFGGILFAMNLNAIGTKRSRIGLVPVIFYSITFPVASFLIIQLLHSENAFLSLALNATGSVILSEVLWGRYVGNEMEYESRPIWKPLVLGIVFTFALLYALGFLVGKLPS